jgi:hypothetical protein
MGTRATVGIGTLEQGWSATLVGYDGDPETLGAKLLELVARHGGDLTLAWSHVASAPNGWRHAFAEPYEADWEHGFDTGRAAPPLLRHSDAYVTGEYGDGALHLDGPEYWYLFDPEARCLRIYAPPSRLEPSPPELLHTAWFDAGGSARVEPPLSSAS